MDSCYSFGFPKVLPIFAHVAHLLNPLFSYLAYFHIIVFGLCQSHVWRVTDICVILFETKLLKELNVLVNLQNGSARY